MGGFSREFQPHFFFLTHSHFDHCGYLPDVQPAGQGVRPESRVWVPKRMESYCRSYLHAAQELNGLRPIAVEDEKPFTLHACAPGETYDVGKGVRVRVLECFHTVDTVGYAFSLVRPKLKKVYDSLSGAELGALRKSGVPIQDEVELPQFVFLGDTTEQVFAANPILFTYPIVIMECTHLLDDQRGAAEKGGHMHWRAVEAVARAQPQTLFVLIHFSSRYKVEELTAFFAEPGRPTNVYPWISSVR